MKSIIKILVIFITGLNIFSCSKSFENNEYQEGETVTYKATQEDKSSCGNTDTKTIINDNIVSWQAGDAIKLFYGTSASAKFTTEDDAEIATFTGNLPIAIGGGESMTPKTIMGIYPYSDESTFDGEYITSTLSNSQTAYDNTFEPGSFPTITSTLVTNYSLAFYNVCGGVKFKVGTEGIKKVVIKGSNGEYIAGKYKTHFGSDGKPETTKNVDNEGKKEITLTSSTGLTPSTSDDVYYYITMLPTTLSNGFIIRLETDTHYIEVKYSNNISRSKWVNLSKVDEGETWKEFDKPTPLTFTSTGTTSISLDKNGSPDDITIKYSKNGTDWDSYTIGESIPLEDGEKLYLTSGTTVNKTVSKNRSNYYVFKFDGEGTIAASGNIMSLLSNNKEIYEVPEYCFYYLFKNASSLKVAPDLPATTLAEYCYAGMFSGCSGLIAAPALPATTLANNCYNNMFRSCTSLTAAPALPATTLADYCYSYMFRNCIGLTAAPALPATVLARNCYNSMFIACVGLSVAPALPATTLAKSCYGFMFSGCTGLTAAPALPVTTLASSCYSYMFEDCTGLTVAPALPATTLAEYCYAGMFSGCIGLTVAPALPATTLTSNCYNCMFEDCTGLTAAPTLSATTLASNCYQWMFYDCSKLNYIKMLATDITAESCLSDWVNGVAETGTFVKNSEATWDVTGADGVPEGWEIETE